MRSLMFGAFEVSIRQDILRGVFKVYMYRRENRETYFITKAGLVHAIQEGAPFDENEVVFAEMSQDQLAAFAEAMSEMGIKTNHDSIAEGKLAATERHLEDMRLIALARFNKPAKQEPQNKAIARELFGDKS